MTRDELLRKITAHDFYIIDLHLYLDTHPDDAQAIACYNACVTEANALHREFERRFGMLVADVSESAVPWEWIKDPWPWQKKFNFNLEA